jgi:acyl carrier protein
MADPSTLFRVIEVVRKEFPGAPADLSAASEAADVDGWDSVSHAMLVLGLEETFGAPLEFERTLETNNLGALSAYIDSVIKSSR